MKARVKATGEIWEFSQINEITFKSAINGHLYCAEELEFLEPSVFTPDYWTRLEHQYAGMAMQGMVRTVGHDRMYPPEKIAIFAVACATALIEKLKEKEERK